MTDPAWLPPRVKLTDSDGNVSRYYDLLYDFYLEDLVYYPPIFEGLPIQTLVEPMKQDKERGFWHILEGGNEDNLAGTMGRHERIRWIKPIIEAVGSDRVLIWKRPVRKNVVKPHIVLHDFSYIVVLRQHQNFIKLLTAFPVEREKRKSAYKKEWERYKHSLK